jgi:signal transduction histidine kinase
MTGKSLSPRWKGSIVPASGEGAPGSIGREESETKADASSTRLVESKAHQSSTAPGQTLPLANWTRLLCSLIAGLIAGISIVGWLTGAEMLASFRAHSIPMAPTTAVAFLTLAFATLAQSRGGWWRRVAIVGTAFVAIVAVAKLLQFFSGRSLGFDELFVSAPGSFGKVHKGRMAPLTALNFLLAAVTLGCVFLERWRRFAGYLATSVTAISAVVLLGYLHGTPLLYGGAIIPMALSTATAFFFLGCALVAASGNGCWPLRTLSGPSAGSLLLRWFLPVVIAGTILNDYWQTRLVERTNLNPALTSALATLAFALLISAIISQVARIVGGRIDRAEAERNAAEENLRSLNADLENCIATRTAELRAKNEELKTVLADLTRSHEELKQAQVLLIQAEKMQTVGSLAAGVAHEVKNPLAIIEMGLECLKNRSDLDNGSIDMVYGEMREAVNRANTVIGGLLDYSASRDLEIRAHSLQAVVEKSLRLMHHEFARGKVTVVRSFSADVPPCHIDAIKIEQVLINLLTNACHAMPDGGILTVSTAVRTLTASDVKWEAGDRSGCRFRQDEQVAEVRIYDTGPGIPTDAMDKIYDPFFTTKPTGKGTGLGLSVARKIVDLHHGRLELSNAPEGGVVATVLLHLPASTS